MVYTGFEEKGALNFLDNAMDVGACFVECCGPFVGSCQPMLAETQPPSLRPAVLLALMRTQCNARDPRF